MNSLIASLISLILANEPASECHKNCLPSDDGVQFISTFEGYSPFIYKDAVGKDTIGHGHLIREGERFKVPLLPPDAHTLLKTDAQASGKTVNRLVAISWHQNQFDAVNSWTFNLGGGSLAKSTMLKRINAKRHKDVPSEMIKWNKAGNKVLPGLINRREAEAQFYMR